MKERPILFNAPMVRKLLDGSKTQTRRLVKPQPTLHNGNEWHWREREWWTTSGPFALNARKFAEMFCPYGKVGDQLWVRETHIAHDVGHVQYAADFIRDPEGEREHGVTWTPSIHMPRWASRITREITDVRIERLQDISGEDARAEGFDFPTCDCEVCARSSFMCPADASVFVEHFARLWDSINGDCAWDANPWVWALTFRRVTP